MKKINIVAIFLILLFSVMGCKKYLDITPDGRISLQDVWKDPKMTEAYLNTAYQKLNTNQSGLRYFTYAFLDGITDLFHDSDDLEPDGLMAPMWYQGSLSPTYDPTFLAAPGRNNNIYPAYWEAIRNCNVFLANIDHAAVSSEGNRARMKAEAKVLRAWFYFQLYRKYGPLPLFEEPFDLTTDFSKVKRPESFEGLADLIDKDWNDIKDVVELPWRLTVSREKGRMTKAVMLLLRSHAQLYAASPLFNPTNDLAKWEKARDYAKQGIELLEQHGGYRLYYNATEGENSFQNYFLNDRDFSGSPRDRETIMENRDTEATVWGFITLMNGFPQRSDNEKAGSCPTQELVDMFDVKSTGLPVLNPEQPYLDEDHLNPNYFSGSGYNTNDPYSNRDPRFKATVLHNGSYLPGTGLTVQAYVGGRSEISYARKHTRTGYYLNKYINQTVPEGVSPGTYWKRMRFAEFYLNLAEAENELNGPNNAVVEVLKVIRDRVHMPTSTSLTSFSKQQVRAYIQKERAVELALEEHRLWDVRRWKILDKTDKLVTGMRVRKQGPNFTYERFVVSRRSSWQDKYLLFPIPLSEIPVLGEDWQNPGWQ